MNNKLMEKNVFTSIIKWKYVILIFSVIALVGGYIIDSKAIKSEYITEQEGIVGVLKDNNLKNGYGSYWDSSVSSLTSNGEVNIRQITIDGDKATPLIWFCKDDWYKEETHFVLIHNPELAGYGVTEENIGLIFGKPDKVLECDSYKVYVYNSDISKKLEH